MPTTTSPNRLPLDELLGPRARAAARANSPHCQRHRVSRRGDGPGPARSARAAARAISLTAKEYALLEYLLLHRNKVHSRDELFNGVWGSDFLGDSNLIDVYIRYLRGKIDDGFENKLITTVRGVGYTIKD